MAQVEKMKIHRLEERNKKKFISILCSVNYILGRFKVTCGRQSIFRLNALLVNKGAVIITHNSKTKKLGQTWIELFFQPKDGDKTHLSPNNLLCND
jgi:hypothetical protein